MPPSTPPEPLFRIVRGTADAAELAALTAVLMARATQAPPPPAPAGPVTAWRRRAYRPPGSWQRAA
ncbi:acyl-CoA carboxylase subunit epsilon [Streptomyces sp. NPDC018019]|uniref:acyl-CoA carboxylase subunit epsilon n=1 Tax=Streptomyces sp. NPDC018019 TaxID=3365030 RepID=UPI00378BCBFF